METRPKRPGRPPKTEGREDQTKRTILQIAARQFMERGYEQVSLEHIADTGGVTKATIYYYFQNKANLYTEAMTETLRIAARHVRGLLDRDLPARDNLREVAYRHLASVRNDMNTFMNEAEKRLSDEQTARIRQAQDDIHVALADYFSEQMKKGVLAEGDPYFLSHAFTAMLMAGQRDSLRNQAGSVERIADAVVDLFWNGTGNS